MYHLSAKFAYTFRKSLRTHDRWGPHFYRDHSLMRKLLSNLVVRCAVRHSRGTSEACTYAPELRGEAFGHWPGCTTAPYCLLLALLQNASGSFNIRLGLRFAEQPQVTVGCNRSPGSSRSSSTEPSPLFLLLAGIPTSVRARILNKLMRLSHTHKSEGLFFRRPRPVGLARLWWRRSHSPLSPNCPARLPAGQP